MKEIAERYNYNVKELVKDLHAMGLWYSDGNKIMSAKKAYMNEREENNTQGIAHRVQKIACQFRRLKQGLKDNKIA